jgi:hypothetical protein
MPVQRQSMLAIAIGLTAAAGLLLAFALWDLGQRRAAAPAVMAVEKTALVEALEDAPYISSGGTGPTLWVVTATDCPACRAFERRILPKLLDRGIEARVILVAGREAGGGESKLVAAFAKQRDWTTLNAWMAGRSETVSYLEPAATEGFVEWGRASFERIDAALRRNGQQLAAPALFWRVGPEWRASIRPDERAEAYLKDDLARAD